MAKPPRRPIVWAPQPSWTSIEFANLESYGNISTILHRSSVPGQTPETSYRNMMEALRDYRIDDYVTSFPADPAGPFLLGIGLALKGVREFNWLRYERPLGPEGERLRGEGAYEVTRFRIDTKRR